MEDWRLKHGDPGSFSIAADVRLGPTNYTDDQIWSLSLQGGEPSALAIQTTFGLRVKSLRLFPRFVEGDTTYTDPQKFCSLPTIRRFFPNYLEVYFSPIEGLDVTCEYWVPVSNALTGRVTITNSRLIHHNINFQWVSLMTPTSGGERMSVRELASKTILSGRSGDLHPILYMTGRSDTSSGPHPALSIALDLPPGDSRQIKWVFATSSSREESFELAEKTVGRQWDPEIAKIEVMNSGQLKIITGNYDWDAAFALAQNCAMKLLLGPSENTQNTSFVLNREPDQGFSHLGDGLDYNYLWNGQTPIDTDYFSTFLLPAYPDIAQGLILNFLNAQSQNGFIPDHVGLGGQRGTHMAAPILVNLVWRVFQVSEDLDFLKAVFPKLLNFINSWFSKTNDRDGDSLPEWERPSQSGYDDNPLFNNLYPQSLNAKILNTGDPSLCSFLFNEIKLLQKIAGKLNQIDQVASLEKLVENLKTVVVASWDESVHVYRYWDRESNAMSQGEILGHRTGTGEIKINRNFAPPIRLAFQIKGESEGRRVIRIFIHGKGISGNQKIEKIEIDQVFSENIELDIISERVYTSIEFIEIGGANPKDILVVGVMDLSQIDHSLFLPLWAGIPDQSQANELVRNTICNVDVFWKPFGVPACKMDDKMSAQSTSKVHMIWNNLIGEALLRYDFRNKAAELVTRLMDAVITNLKRHNSFYNFYNPTTGTGLGDRNIIRGLPPVNLFLETLGVRIVSPRKVILQGENPFPWPVTIHYKGMTINREHRRTSISFPGGQTAVVKSKEPRVIRIDNT